MEKITTSKNFERHIRSHREIEDAAQWALCGETGKGIAEDLGEFVRFRIQRHCLSAEDLEALRQLLLVYPEDEGCMVTAAMEVICYSHLAY